MGLEHDVAELAQRLARLEERMTRLERLPHPPAGPAPAGPPPLPPPPGPPPPPPVGPPLRAPARRGPAVPRPVRRPVDSEAVLKWVGLTLVVLAAIFLVGTAIGRGWIGPELQLLGATLAGLGLLTGAFRLRATNRSWSLALAVGGAVVLPVCAAAANAGLDLWPNTPALVVLAATVVALGWAAVRLGFEAVTAVAGLAAIAMMLWIGEEPELPVTVVAGWLAAVAVGFIAFTLVERWTVSRLIVTVASTLTLLAVAVTEGPESFTNSERAVALVVLALVASTAWIAPAAARVLGNGPEGWLSAADHRFVASLPSWTWAGLGAVVDFDDSDSWALAGLAVAATYLLIALGARNLLAGRLVLSHALGAGVLVTVALAVLLDGPALLVAVAVQASVAIVIGWRFDDRPLQLQGVIMATVAVAWAVVSMVTGLLEELPAADHLANALVVVLVVAGAVAALAAGSSTIGRGLIVVGWIAGLLWVAAVVVHGPQGQVAFSGAWALAAAVAIAVGVRFDDELARGLGLATLGVVLVKLLTIDLAAIDTLWRVGLFFVIGSGLLRLGYLLPRLSPGVEADPLSET